MNTHDLLLWSRSLDGLAGGKIRSGIHRGYQLNITAFDCYVLFSCILPLSLFSHLSPLPRNLWSTEGLALCFDVNKMKLNCLQVISSDYFDFFFI